VFLGARRNPPWFFLESTRRHGDVVSMRFGWRRVVLLSHPDDVKHVLQDHHLAFGKSAPAARIRPLFGDSLTTVDGDRWRRQRRVMRSAVHPGRVEFVERVIAASMAERLDRWPCLAARGEAMDALSEMKDVTRAIIVRLLFGEVPANDASVLGQALDVALEHVDDRLWSVLGWLPAPLPSHWRFRHAIRTIDASVRAMVERDRRRAARSDTLLSILLNARDPESGTPMADEELRDEVKALLVAGHTTTSSALGWLWYVLAGNPEPRRRLQREARAAATGEVAGLGYSRRVIEEVLRLYPPTWVTARTALADDVIRGYRIPAGSLVLLSPFVTHRRDDVWEEPERFDPERFTPERSRGRPPFAYFPFGGGPRSCLGAWLASVVMERVVTAVAQRYSLSLVPGTRVHARPGLTLRPAPGVPMIVEVDSAQATSR